MSNITQIKNTNYVAYQQTAMVDNIHSGAHCMMTDILHIGRLGEG